MKINTLELNAYGPFTDKILDFSNPNPGLHIIFGPNEAGKTTALRGLVGLLYGFGHKIDDDWQHDYRSLCVGASLIDADHGERAVLRYKRRKNDLVDKHTAKPIPKEVMEEMLGKMDQQAFSHAFGISHEALRKGVDSVLAAGGNLGHALFAAGSGLNSLKQVMGRLETLQGQLFAPRAKNAKINKGLSTLIQIRKKQREASVSHRQWKAVKEGLDEIKAKKETIVSQMLEVTTQISLYSRYKAARPHVTRMESLSVEIEAIGPTPVLAENFSQMRTDTLVASKSAAQALKTLTRRIADIRNEVDKRAYDARYVENAEKAEALAAEIPIHKKALEDARHMEKQTGQLQSDIEKLLLQLGKDLTAPMVSTLRPGRADRSRITRLANQRAGIINELNEAKSAHLLAGQILEKTQDDLDRLGICREMGELRDCLDRALQNTHIEQRIFEEQAQMDKTEAQIGSDISALGLWQGDARALEMLALPFEETLHRFEEDFEVLSRQFAEVQKETQAIKTQIKQYQTELDRLNREKVLPHVEDLETDRKIRDSGWQAIRDVWLGGKEASETNIKQLSKDPDAAANRHKNPNHDLARAYEGRVLKADQTADALRENAGEVVKIKALKNDIENLEEKIEQGNAKTGRLEEKRKALTLEWKALWEAMGIKALSPKEMMRWLTRTDDIKRHLKDLRERKTIVRRLENELTVLKSDLEAGLRHAGAAIPDQLSFSGLMDMAKRLLLENDSLKNKIRACEVRMEENRQNINAGKKRISDAENKFADWQTQWQTAVEKLGFAGDADPDAVNDFILGIDEIHGLLEKSNALQQRIADIKRDYAAYEAQVGLAAEATGFETGSLNAEEAAALMWDSTKKQIEVFKAHRRMEKEAATILHQKAAIEKEIAGQEEMLHQLCLQANARHVDELGEIENKVREKEKVTHSLAAVNDRLIELAAGEPMEDFIACVKTQDIDALEAKLRSLADRQAQLSRASEQLTGDIALKQRELEAMAGESQALLFAEQAEACAGEVLNDVSYYIRLKLADHVLAKAIEQYREKNQHPVLKSAGTYFNMLTNAMFSGLRADYDDRGEPVIKAIRASGETLTVEQMSDGSRDQLFLALRLGGLAQYIQNNGPMPFIIDDVLVHFDDDRSKAAFCAFSDLAAQTQIIFFTHHRHLLQLAEAGVPADRLQIHFL